MSNQVFANFMEIACKAASGKTACSFPDVCFTPPQTPATPPGVPIPYPNTAFSSDTSDGSSTVKISNQEVMLKNKSFFKKSSGDEAGSAPKKGLVNSKISGKVYFTAWSMDVKVENENVVRNLDLTTHNHASTPANASIPWPHIETTKTGAAKQCKNEVDEEQKACKDYKKQGKKNVCAEAGLNVGIKKVRASGKSWSSIAGKALAGKSAADKCLRARRCRLVAYNAQKDGVNGCCPSQTPDHLVPKSSFFLKSVAKGKKMPGWNGYKPSRAPCMCAEGPSNNEGSHGLRHSAHGMLSSVGAGKTVSFKKEVKLAAKSARKVFGASNCSEACLKAQLEKGHEDMSKQPPPDVKHSPSGTSMDSKGLLAALKKLVKPFMKATAIS
jgi:Domain of unknown function (DUF4150)/GHH signature containing HNH/Endo VII superfamily nuclease toxin  2